MFERRLLLGVLFLSTAALPSPAFVVEVPLLRFVQISDPHIGAGPNQEATLNGIVDSINALPQLPAFVIASGDLTQDGLAAEYTKYKSIMSRLHPSIAVHNVTGNHDMQSGTYADWQAQLGPLYHSFTHMNCLFIMTNGVRDVRTYQSDGEIDPAQLAWIRAQLDGAGSMTHVVFADHF